jgi:lipopolysaccharide export system protein LptC
MQRLAGWFPVLVLVALAALTFWLDAELQPPESPGAGATRGEPDYIVENFSATRIGPDGTARYTLSARRMLHYPADDTTVLESPTLVNFSNSAAKITVTSKHALLSSNGDEAHLSGDVRLVRAAFPGKTEMTVTTSYLHVIPDRNFAQTDKPVEIVDMNTRTTSVGLEFNNETRILKLLSHVRSTYEKPRPAK